MKVFASLDQDSHQGWVWIHASNLPPRSVVKITNSSTNKTIYCEALQIDNNFLRIYNKKPRHFIKYEDLANTIVIAAWYRAGLAITDTGEDANLIILPASKILGHFLAALGHPQAIVRLSALLGGVGFFLGVVGLILGVISLR